MAEVKSQEFYRDNPRTPVLDPTERTTETLLREIASLKEVVFTRLDGMDRAIVLFDENLTRAPTDVDKQIGHLKALVFGRFDTTDEKFGGIQVQFSERDVRTEQTSRDSKVAVDAALQAAKEAVGAQQTSNATAISKSEAATSKQIDTLALLIQTGSKATDDKINDIKERLTRIEGASKGHGDAWGYLIGGVGIVAAVISIVFALTRHA